MNLSRAPLFALLRLLAAVLCVWLALIAFDSQLVAARLWLAGAAAGLGLLLLFFQLRSGRHRSGQPLGPRVLAWLTLVITLLAIGHLLQQAAALLWSRTMILRAPPQALRNLGQHLVVGFSDEQEISHLASQGLIGGIYLTRRNTQGRSAQDLRALVQRLQALRRAHGLPPLWVAADQEGGAVSHLSPPLPVLAPLSRIVQQLPDPVSRSEAVKAQGLLHGQQLAAVGVNINLAPVVDLDFGRLNPHDRYSRISERAISSNPALVADVAADYCSGLARQHVHCTLKHFPGLGRVVEDTHVSSGNLTASMAELERSDWIPFRSVMKRRGVFVMVGHARLLELDDRYPSSYSPAVIGLLRQRWRFDGVLMTDDFCMQAVRGSREGIGEAAVMALNAGVDLILVTQDPDQFYPIMRALLRAQAEGRLDQAQLDTSSRRLNRRGLPAS